MTPPLDGEGIVCTEVTAFWLRNNNTVDSLPVVLCEKDVGPTAESNKSKEDELGNYEKGNEAI